MPLTNEEYIERLGNCLESKLLLLEEILEITEIQKCFLDKEDFESLNPFSDKKQEKIDEIDKLDNEFEVYFKRLKTNLKVKSLDEIDPHRLKGAKELKQNVEEVYSFLKKISEIEKENKEKADSALNELKESIYKVKASKKANSAYLGNKNFETESYFIDSKK
jgi:GTPase involved in cell partitioning and DNA repair